MLPGATFLASCFKPFVGIRKIQHFRFSRNSPGIVFSRNACDSAESEYNLLKRGVRSTRFSVYNLPPVLMPGGLSTDRAKYLHKDVRPFVRPEFRDTLCPSIFVMTKYCINTLYQLISQNEVICNLLLYIAIFLQ